MMNKNNLYLVEYYRMNSETKEPGWEISFAWVQASYKKEVEGKIKTIDRLFDEIITIEEQSTVVKLATTGKVIFCL